jgi:hypothetical protein
MGKRKKEETLWMMVTTWTNCNLIREPLGTSSLKREQWGCSENNTAGEER